MVEEKFVTNSHMEVENNSVSVNDTVRRLVEVNKVLQQNVY